MSGGYAMYLQDGFVVHDYNYYGEMFRVRAPLSEQRAQHVVTYDFTKTGPLRGTGQLLIDGEVAGDVRKS